MCGRFFRVFPGLSFCDRMKPNDPITCDWPIYQSIPYIIRYRPWDTLFPYERKTKQAIASHFVFHQRRTYLSILRCGRGVGDHRQRRFPKVQENRQQLYVQSTREKIGTRKTHTKSSPYKKVVAIFRSAYRDYIYLSWTSKYRRLQKYRRLWKIRRSQEIVICRKS